MDEKKLEKLLYEIYEEPIIPSNELIQSTKNRIKHNKGMQYILALAITLNVLIVFALIAVLILSPFHLIFKVTLYLGVSSLMNVLILPIYFYREVLTSFFINN